MATLEQLIPDAEVLLAFPEEHRHPLGLALVARGN